jgi:hypothetical protein
MRSIAAAVLLIALMPINTKAIDGYKEFKFGMSVDAVRKLAKTRLIRFKTHDGILGSKGQDFPFAGKKVEISFFFADTFTQKLLRVAFAIPIDTALATCLSLREKYGEASSHSDQSIFDAIDISRPNTLAFIAFDNDTILVKIMSDEANNQVVAVIYTSPEYEQLLLQLQQNKLKDDL